MAGDGTCGLLEPLVLVRTFGVAPFDLVAGSLVVVFGAVAGTVDDFVAVLEAGADVVFPVMAVGGSVPDAGADVVVFLAQGVAVLAEAVGAGVLSFSLTHGGRNTVRVCPGLSELAGFNLPTGILYFLYLCVYVGGF